MITLHLSARRMLAVALVPAALALCAHTAAAQADAPRDVDPRWQPWVGCWTPAVDTTVISLSGARSSNVVCVTPVSGATVEITSIVGGRAVARERVVASGERVSRTRDGCPGWDSANWSADGQRLFLRSEYTCPGNLARKESGVFAMTLDGQWLDMQGVDVMGTTSVRVTRFHDAGVELASAARDSVRLVPRGEPNFAALTARLGAAAVVSPDDVLEVAGTVDRPVAEAWLAENGQGFTLDAKTLVRLADAGMPKRMIDIMVALSYPKQFVLRGNGSQVARVGPATRQGSNTGTTYATGGSRPILYDDFSCGAFGSRLGGFGYGGYGYGGYALANCYGNYGYNRAYGYGGYGYGGNYYWGQQPIIIVNPNQPSRPAQPQGRAVNGRGYTRDAFPSSNPITSSGGSSGASRTSSPATTPGTTGGGSGSGGSSGSSGGGRTAKARGG